MTRVIQGNRFLKAYKKLPNTAKMEVDKAVMSILADPLIGTYKSHDISGIRVYKFRIQAQLTLLAYSHNPIDDVLELLLLGSHENFYRDLKN